MGQGESRPAGANGAGVSLGLHVLRVAEGSPAAAVGIEPFFDHVVAYDGYAVDQDANDFITVVEEHEKQRTPLHLQLWSTKREELRQVSLIPSRVWSLSTSQQQQQQQQDAQPSLLGLSLRLCAPEGALDHVWHILDILEGSPAQAAGLVSYGDYVIGYAGGVLRGEGDFYRLVEQHTEKPLRLFVYNSDFDVTREVVIVPNRDWGTGDSLLGCGVGYGLLHRIPRPQDRPAAPPELSDPTAPLDAGAPSGRQPQDDAPYDFGRHGQPGDEDEDDDYEASQGVSLVNTSGGVGGGNSNGSGKGGLYSMGQQRSGMLQQVVEES